MNFWKNLLISQKILYFCYFAIVLIIFVGATGFYFSSANAESMKKMYYDQTAAIHEMGVVRLNFYRSNADIVAMMLTTSDVENKKIMEDIKELRQENNTMLKKYQSTNLDDTEKENLKVFNDKLKDYRSSLNDMIALASKNRNKEAYALYYSSQSKFIDLNDALNDLIEYNLSSAEKLAKDGESAATLGGIIISVSLILAIAISLYVGVSITTMLKRRMKNLQDWALIIANGDFTVNYKIESNDEIGQTARSLGTISTNLRALVQKINGTVEEILASSEEMSASADQTAQGAQQTANSTAQLAQGTQEISANIEKGVINVTSMNTEIQTIFQEATIIADLGNATEENANVGSEHLAKAVSKIDNIKNVSSDISVTISNLGDLSKEIEQIVDLIKSIAGQTNLLALNAAIEAARAGEHGKGFAVVADEVKILATQSAAATDKITAMIKEIQGITNLAVTTMGKATLEVEEGVSVVDKAEHEIDNIIGQVKVINTKIQTISKQIDQMANNSEDVLKTIENISAVVEETAASAEEISSITEEQTASMEEISASSQTLAKIAEELNKQMSAFKV